MNYAIVISARDQAGLTIKDSLTKSGFNKTNDMFDGFPVYTLEKTKLYTTSKDSVFFGDGENIDADFIIFATKHQSKAGLPSLTTHSVGNWGIAELGGKEKTLGIAPALYLKMAVQLLEERGINGFEVFQEVTHHGPTINKPVLFIEIGSTPKEYSNNEAGDIIASVILDLLAFEPTDKKTAIGIGGLHHSPSFKKIQIQTDIAVGHICPKYALQFLTKEMVLQTLEKTLPKAEIIILDWKGLGEHKERIKKIVEEISSENNIEIMRTQEF